MLIFYKSRVSPQISAVSKLTQSCYTLTYRADVYWVWFAVTLIHKNMHVTAITIDRIQLRQDI